MKRVIRQFFIVLVCILLKNNALSTKRALQKSHEKSQFEKWEERFLKTLNQFNQTTSLINLLNKIATEELYNCPVVILYDKFTEKSNDLLLEKLLKNFPLTYVHGQITDEYDVMRCKTIIGPQTNNKVIVVARSSQWRVYEFLAHEDSQSFLNLLVIAMSEKIVSTQTELPYILYTHKLFTDALGSSSHQVLTSWKNSTFTQNIPLFGKKLVDGFAGHRFIISLAQQPPFVIKKGKDENDEAQWDGIEIRLLELLSKIYNFTTDYREAKDIDRLGPGEAVTAIVKNSKANLGIAGIYITDQRLKSLDVSQSHSYDCAAFVSLTSTALPRYRAIMGPFHWTVWMTLTITYLIAIFPLAFSDKHSLKHIIERPEEVENMFWYVFGTFTNCFTFVSKDSWSKSDKLATRLLIGFYWVFTIIITSCYTGSIIAFVTLPIYPETVDTPEELLRGRYQIGILDKGGWQYWFDNSSDLITQKLFKKIDFVPTVESGLKNTTKAFFWPYAFLGSKAQLDYIIRTNFTTQNKRNLLHISSECFVPFSVGFVFGKNSIYQNILSNGILKAVQYGFMKKLKNDVEWHMMRSTTGKLLAANSFENPLKNLAAEDRALTLDDTQGMFLLLGIGFVLGGVSLLSEWFGGCFHLCKLKRPKTSKSIDSNHRTFSVPTPREKLHSLKYNSSNNSEHSGHRNSFDIIEPINNCIVHNNAEEEDILSQMENDIGEEIDKLFDFDEIFGNENSLDKNNIREQLVDD